MHLTAVDLAPDTHAGRGRAAAWADDSDIAVSDRGCIPASIAEQYEAATKVSNADSSARLPNPDRQMIPVSLSLVAARARMPLSHTMEDSCQASRAP